MSHSAFLFRVLGMALALFVATPASVHAQPADPALSRAMDEAFARMMREPANLEITFGYAELAARAGNFEGSIAALERMLMVDPGLPRVRLELATLYFRLGSYDLASSYIDSALEANPPPDVRQRIDQFASEIKSRQSRHKFTGSVLVGVRGQTNATSGYSTNVVPIPALAGTEGVDVGSGRRIDWNLFTAISGTHTLDLVNQRGDTFETGITLYATRHNHVKTVETGVAEITMGPRFNLAELLTPGASLRPYALANVVTLNRNRYFTSMGGGLGYQMPLTETISWTAGFETRAKNYRTDASRSTVRNQVGYDQSYTTGFNWVLSASDALSFNAGFTRGVAREGFKSSRQHNFASGYTRKVDAPFRLAPEGERWTLGATVGRFITDYTRADTTVDPDTRRGDREWRYNLMVGVPITKSISGVLQGQRQTVWSSYLINKYTNNSITLGVSWLI
jgi:hypothetical protein